MSAIPLQFAMRPEEEFEPMTYQVVALGTDGLILGSDRKVFSVPPSAYSANSYRQFDTQFKFVRSENDAIICACSGNQHSRRVANEIVKEADPKQSAANWEAYLWSKCRQQIIGSGEIVIVRSSYLDAYWITIGPDGQVSQISDKQCVGANASACFIATHFYRRVGVDELKRFALLILDYAARELPNWIGNGYDLVILKKDQQPQWMQLSSDDHFLCSIRNSFNLAINQSLFP